MSFVPRKVARKNQPKSTSTSQSRTSTCSNPSTSTSLSLSSLENGKGKSKAIDDDEPSLPAKNQATSNSDVEPKPEYSSQNHLTANALYHLLSPVYLVHPNNIQLKDLLMNLGTQNGTKGIQEGGETYLHLSRLLTNPIISCLCSSLDSLTSALRELQDLEFIKVSRVEGLNPLFLSNLTVMIFIPISLFLAQHLRFRSETHRKCEKLDI